MGWKRNRQTSKQEKKRKDLNKPRDQGTNDQGDEQKEVKTGQNQKPEKNTRNIRKADQTKTTKKKALKTQTPNLKPNSNITLFYAKRMKSCSALLHWPCNLLCFLLNVHIKQKDTCDLRIHLQNCKTQII